MVEVVEVLRLWLRGRGYRQIARSVQLDRKTVRRYVEAAMAAGLDRTGGENQLKEELVGEVVERVRPSGPGVRGHAWAVCELHRERIGEWVEKDLRLTKVARKLAAVAGEAVPYRTLHRFCVTELGLGSRRATVRVADGKPGEELQVDFGRLGYLPDRASGKRVLLWALVFTACYSRHLFVWVTRRQRVEDVIDGCEAAWRFFGGVFRVLIPDNLKAIVERADPMASRINETFRRYAQSRGLEIDPARVRAAQDKARVERAVPFVRESFFRGERFGSVEETQEGAESWCREVGGRLHGTTRQRPGEVFEREEKGELRPLPAAPYVIPVVATVRVHADHHLVLEGALYSVPSAYRGERVTAYADGQWVRVYVRGKLVKTHPRQAPGGRSTDPADYPNAAAAVYATRDEETLRKLGREAGEQIGRYVERLLEGPLPWTRMRHVYRLLGLVRRYGRERVEQACRRALELEVVDVTRIGRMLERALEGGGPPPPSPAAAGKVVPLRFARPTSAFARQEAPGGGPR